MDSETEMTFRASGRAPVGVPVAHALGGDKHTPSTLAELNALVSDATLKSGADITLEIVAAISGLLSNQGGYDAAINVPDLDTSPSGIFEGYAWFVEVAGPFFTEDLEIGDLIYAKIDNPTSLSDWVRLEHNLLPATTTVAGIVKLAADAGTVAGTVVDASDSRLPQIVLNTTHRTSDGKDHSDVVLNNAHRVSDGSDHGFIDQNVTSGSSPTFDGANITGLPTAAFDDNSVTNAKLAEMPTNTVKVNNAAGTGNPIDLELLEEHVLRRNLSGNIESGKVQTAHIANNQVNNNKMAQAAANTVKVNNTAALDNLTDLSMPSSTFLVRLAAGDIIAGTVAQVKTLLDYFINDMGDVDTTTEAPAVNDTLTWDGSNWVPVPLYTKLEGIDTTSSNNFNSNVPTNVPGMSQVISHDGDYIFYCVIACNNDQNEELDLHVAVNGVTLTDLVVFDRQQKNNDQSIQGTFPLNGLVDTDIVTFQLDTRGDNVDLSNRRWIGQSWG